VTAIAGGGFHSLALKNDGTVWAWGLNYYGELGNNSTTDSPIPVQVSNLTNMRAIAVFCGFYSLALKNDRTVWAWGNNSKGQLGNNSTTDSHIPVQVSNLTNVIAIAGGYEHSLALKSDGTIWAWGNNFYGQLGNNTTTNSSVPVQSILNQ
jgi:alpha-tubulin suppressor-like RCC1 family protein